jgi:putative FmdB family regulatory protein
MPKYCYKCKNCNTYLELFHEIGFDPGCCPVCKSELKKVYTSFRITEKHSETKEEELLKSNKRKFEKLKEKVKTKTYEDIKND